GEAEVVYEGKPDDMYIAAMHDHTPGYERDFVSRTLAFYNDELYLNTDGELRKIDAPNSANKSVHKDWLVLELREPYEAAGKTFPAGSLIAANFDAFMAGGRDFTALFEPTDTTSLAGVTATANHLVLNILDDVKNDLQVLTPPADGASEWSRSDFTGHPEGSVSVSAVDPDHSDAVWVQADGYLSPATLAIAEVGQAPQVLKTMPVFFDASTHEVDQFFATSR